MLVYFSTYANPLYSTCDLRQVRYTTHDLLARGFTAALLIFLTIQLSLWLSVCKVNINIDFKKN